MATVDEIREVLRAQPFRTFDLKLVDGTRYHVRRPDWLIIPPVARPREIEYFDVASNGEDYRTRWIDPNLISEITIPSEAAPRARPTDQP
jgi:hypothetical protein